MPSSVDELELPYKSRVPLYGTRNPTGCRNTEGSSGPRRTARLFRRGGLRNAINCNDPSRTLKWSCLSSPGQSCRTETGRVGGLVRASVLKACVIVEAGRAASETMGFQFAGDLPEWLVQDNFEGTEFHPLRRPFCCQLSIATSLSRLSLNILLPARNAGFEVYDVTEAST